MERLTDLLDGKASFGATPFFKESALQDAQRDDEIFRNIFLTGSLATSLFYLIDRNFTGAFLRQPRNSGLLVAALRWAITTNTFHFRNKVLSSGQSYFALLINVSFDFLFPEGKSSPAFGQHLYLSSEKMTDIAGVYHSNGEKEAGYRPKRLYSKSDSEKSFSTKQTS